MVYGIWYLLFGIWYMVYGIWYMVYGIWYEVYGIWYIICVLGLRVQGFGIGSAALAMLRRPVRTLQLHRKIHVRVALLDQVTSPASWHPPTAPRGLMDSALRLAVCPESLIWYMIHGIWYLVYGIWYMVDGIYYIF